MAEPNIRYRNFDDRRLWMIGSFPADYHKGVPLQRVTVIQENPDGSKSAIGTTATLELTPDQTKVISVAQQMAERLQLALRSVANAQESDTGAAEYLLSGNDGEPLVQVIKTGQIVNGANDVQK